MSLLIGVADEAVSKPECVSWTENRIGGKPAWMSGSSATAIPICNSCLSSLTLVVQLYCPLSESAFHRCLYVFACPRPACVANGSWKVLRCMQQDNSYSATKQEVSRKDFNDDVWTMDQDDWGDADDWGEEDDAGQSSSSGCDSRSERSPSAEPCGNERLAAPEASNVDLIGAGDQAVPGDDLSLSLSQMAVDDSLNKTKDEESGDVPCVVMEESPLAELEDRLDQLKDVLNTKDTQSPAASSCLSEDQPLVLKMFYLNVFDGGHQGQNSEDEKHIQGLIRDYEQSEGKQLKELMADSARKKVKGSAESYEKTEVKHGDRMFHKFLKELQKFPQQCIRYQRHGLPLLAQELPAAHRVAPPCSACGAVRVFELQLTPGLIPWLTSPDCTPSGIEFGTVLIYTCSQSCPPLHSGDVLEETAVFQNDPDCHLYR